MNASLLEAQSDIATLENKLLEVQSKVEDLETRIPKKENISVTAPAFEPTYNTKDTRRHENRLYNFEVTEWAGFEASVQLPHGATVTKLTSYWYDNDTYDVSCSLYRFNQTISWIMAYTHSLGTPGLGSSYDDTIDYATVDNNQYAYKLSVTIPPHDMDYYFIYAVIEYEYQR